MVNGCSFFLWKFIQIVELVCPEIAAALSKNGFGFHFGFLTRRVDWNGEMVENFHRSFNGQNDH